MSSLSSFPPLPQSLLQTNKQRIVIYCDEYQQSYWPRFNINYIELYPIDSYYPDYYFYDYYSWNRTTLSQGGLGGSEEAVIYLAEALSEFQKYKF